VCKNAEQSADEINNGHAFRRAEMFEHLQNLLKSRGDPAGCKDIAQLFGRMSKSGNISYAKKENIVGNEDSVRKLLMMSRRFRQAEVYHAFKELQMINGTRTIWSSWTIVVRVPQLIQDNAALRFVGLMIYDAMTGEATMSDSPLVTMIADATAKSVASICQFLAFKYDIIQHFIKDVFSRPLATTLRWCGSRKSLQLSLIMLFGGRKCLRVNKLGLHSACVTVCSNV
jgi:hypothetical protein